MSISEQYLQAEMAHIHASGLFLADWYVQRHPELARPGADPLAYFCKLGWRQGDLPNPYFDPNYYLTVNQDVARAGLNPLLHYVTHGDKEGRDPCGYFHVAWYRQEFQVAAGENALKHFLDRRFTGQVAPVPLFDPVYYFENNPDVATAGSDPFEHFLAFGAAEARNPCAEFDMRFYQARYGAVLGGLNPLLHYLANRSSGMFFATRPAHETLIPGAVRHATRPSAEFEEFRPVHPQAVRRAKLLAFYLPQYHPVPENDAWWGKGFTDWTNLSRGLPRFAGHLQPRVPRDLGFYTLDDPETLRRQVEMAKGAGLSGFVLHFYWFNGRPLLDKPLNHLLTDATIEFPFCVSWANENWTRRWDGLEREVLVAQEYRAADDADLIACFAGLFADSRYIRVDGRPLLMIYRAGLIPDPARRIAAWRALFATQYGENPLILMVQSLEDHDPTPYGLDGAVEFPPHKITDALVPMNDGLDLFDPDFNAKVYDYQDVVDASLAVPRPTYPFIKTIVPGWDNDPRREGKGLVLQGATPAKYQAWLEALVVRANEHPFYGENLVCVNAWNEWAEGAFLEPDVHFGAAFLNATGRALCETVADSKTTLLLVGHDAQPHGAQILLLHLARHYAQVCGIDVQILLLGPGPLVPDYQKVGAVTLTNDKAAIANIISYYARIGIRAAIINSVASARLVPALAEHGIESTLLVHEMPKLLAEHNLQMSAKLGALAAKTVVFPGEYPYQRFCEALQVKLNNALIMPQGNYQNMRFSEVARAEIRQRYKIPEHAFLVLGCGFGDIRKGFDLFIQIARTCFRERHDIYFIWIGEIQPMLRVHLADEIADALATDRLLLPGFCKDPAPYFSAADVFALTSREDPFPTVVMEAIACGVPVVAFENSGAVPALLRTQRCGLVAKFGDPIDFYSQLKSLLDHGILQSQHAQLVALAAALFLQRNYAQNLCAITLPQIKSVSICVVNYNQSQYLAPRLQSVFAQTYPVIEILLFDDGSVDGSVALALKIAQESGREVQASAHLQNAGSAFALWRQAAAAAKGDYVWIAEADDVSEPHFLGRVMQMLTAQPDALLAFTDSRMIDADGAMTAESYRDHYRQAGATILETSGVWNAASFAQDCLAVQNLMFNISAVVWRRDALCAALDRLDDLISEWTIAGDWRLYVEVLAHEKGSIAYLAEPLNQHRRHAESVTQTVSHAKHLKEISRMHDVLAETFELAPAVRQAQRRYVEHVKNMFSVSETKQNPKVKSTARSPSRIARKT